MRGNDMYPFIDMHCDTLHLTAKGGTDALRKNDGMLDFERMNAAGQMAQFFAIFFPPKKWIKHSDEDLYITLRDNYRAALSANSDIILPALCAGDIEKNYSQGKMSAVLTIEDGRIVDGKIENLIRLHTDGVRAVALTWNGENCFGYPNSDNREEMVLGLKPFGLEAVEIMNELGVLIDVSHLSDGGFWDVAKVSKKPFIATHSNARALCPHRRNLTDEMLKTLADCGGVTGLNFCADFLPKDLASPESTAKLLADHAMHIMNVGGEDVIALGSDFDGIDKNVEVCEPTKMHLIFDELQKRGVTSRQLEKLASKNILRVMHDSIG